MVYKILDLSYVKLTPEYAVINTYIIFVGVEKDVAINLRRDKKKTK